MKPSRVDFCEKCNIQGVWVEGDDLSIRVCTHCGGSWCMVDREVRLQEAASLQTGAVLDLIAAERERQREKGYDAEWDKQHEGGQLTEAALCYGWLAGAMIIGAKADDISVKTFDGKGGFLKWPWDEDGWCPEKDVRANLVKACALLVAEIERLHVQAGVPVKGGC